MQDYMVKVPITGYALIRVEAKDEDQAIENAMKETVFINQIEEFDSHEVVAQGNVFYGILNEPEIY